jgi:hypothetical protein
LHFRHIWLCLGTAATHPAHNGGAALDVVIAQTSPQQDVDLRVGWFPDRNSAPSRCWILLQGLCVFKDYLVSLVVRITLFFGA